MAMIVKCPRCERKFDAGFEESIPAERMAISMKFACPACLSLVRLPGCELADSDSLPAVLIKQMAKQCRLLPEDDPTPIDHAEDHRSPPPST